MTDTEHAIKFILVLSFTSIVAASGCRELFGTPRVASVVRSSACCKYMSFIEKCQEVM